MTTRIEKLLVDTTVATPCLVLDQQRVAHNYQAFRRHMPKMTPYYAVKANPHPAFLAMLVAEGAYFDCASFQEIIMVLNAGATADRISYGSTIKKAADIAKAYQMGVRQFAFDAIEELQKIADHAPGATVICRILTNGSGSGAQWPLSRKFGCDSEMAIGLLVQAAAMGLAPRGVSFHVGSQQLDINAWDAAISRSATIFAAVQAQGIALDILNLGGGFPTAFNRQNTPSLDVYGAAIMASVERHFGDNAPQLLIEPGRALVGDAGVIVTEVVLVSTKSADDSQRWVYLDVGRFHGLAETESEAIRYRISVPERATSATTPAVIAGPTCDSVDTLYERNPIPMPVDLAAGDIVLVHDTGAYTSTYSSVGFNGFAPLRVCLAEELAADRWPALQTG